MSQGYCVIPARHVARVFGLKEPLTVFDRVRPIVARTLAEFRDDPIAANLTVDLRQFIEMNSAEARPHLDGTFVTLVQAVKGPGVILRVPRITDRVPVEEGAVAMLLGKVGAEYFHLEPIYHEGPRRVSGRWAIVAQFYLRQLQGL